MTTRAKNPLLPHKPIPVCCAIIEHRGKILIAQRGHKGSNALQWEFPGGKQEAGESLEECLQREIMEELSVKVQILAQLTSVTYSYPDKTITLIPFVCQYSGSTITPREHKSICWISPDNISGFTLSEADIKVWQHYLLYCNAATK